MIQQGGQCYNQGDYVYQSVGLKYGVEVIICQPVVKGLTRDYN